MRFLDRFQPREFRVEVPISNGGNTKGGSNDQPYTLQCLSCIAMAETSRRNSYLLSMSPLRGNTDFEFKDFRVSSNRDYRAALQNTPLSITTRGKTFELNSNLEIVDRPPGSGYLSWVKMSIRLQISGGSNVVDRFGMEFFKRENMIFSTFTQKLWGGKGRFYLLNELTYPEKREVPAEYAIGNDGQKREIKPATEVDTGFWILSETIAVVKAEQIL